MPILDQANSLRRLVARYDESDVSSFSYPCSTVLGGVPGEAPSYRLSSPLHPIDSQSPEWGKRFTLAPRGQEFHLHEVSVIQARFIYLLSCLGPHSWLSHFRGTGRSCMSNCLRAERPLRLPASHTGAATPIPTQVVQLSSGNSDAVQVRSGIQTVR